MCNCKSSRPHHIRVQDEQLRRELVEIIMRAPRRYSLADAIAQQSPGRPTVRQLLAVQAYERVREQQPDGQLAIENPQARVSAEDYLKTFAVEPEK